MYIGLRDKSLDPVAFKLSKFYSEIKKQYCTNNDVPCVFLIDEVSKAMEYSKIFIPAMNRMMDNE